MTGFGSLSQLLDDLAPAVAVEEPAWDDVLARTDFLSTTSGETNGQVPVPSVPAGRRRTRVLSGLRRRPLLVALIVLVGVLVPVSAFAVAKQDPWWFVHQPFEFGPSKGREVVVIRQGSWAGQSWVLTAFRSGVGLCYQLTQEGGSGKATNQGGAACGAVPGTFAPTANGRRRITIGYLGGSLLSSNGTGQVRYVVGPVVNRATEVVIMLANGTVMRTATFNAPKTLGVSARFYAVSVPSRPPSGPTQGSCAQRVGAQALTRPVKLVGLDASGRAIAALTVPGQPPAFAQVLCAPHRNHFVLPPGLPVAARTLKTVARLTGPYGARATVAVGDAFQMRSGRLLPNGRLRRFSRLSRCWMVKFSNGESQGTCAPVAKRYEPELSPQVQHAGRDTFVIAQTPPRTEPAIVRVVLQLAHGETLSAAPVDGVVVFTIPRDALSTTKSQRGFLTGYDESGRQVFFNNGYGHVRFARQPVYYRSCPPGSSCHG